MCTTEGWCQHGAYLALDEVCNKAQLFAEGQYSRSQGCDVLLQGSTSNIHELLAKVHAHMTLLILLLDHTAIAVVVSAQVGANH